MPAVELVFYRTLIAGVTLLLVLSLRKIEIKATFREQAQMLATGSVIGIHWILFFLSVKMSSVSMCMTGMSTLALWSAILEPMLIKQRRFRGYELFISLIIIIAIALIYRFESAQSMGLTIAIISAFMAAVFAIINARLIKHHHYQKLTCYEMFGAALTCVIFFPIYATWFTDTGSLQLTASISEWFWIAMLAIVCTVYAYSAYVELLKRLSVFTINLTANMEPVYGIILAAIILGDYRYLSTGFYIAALLILATLIAHPFLKRRYQSANQT